MFSSFLFFILLEGCSDLFLSHSNERRALSADDNSGNSSAYNTVAIQFAPKHLGLVLVCCLTYEIFVLHKLSIMFFFVQFIFSSIGNSSS